MKLSFLKNNTFIKKFNFFILFFWFASIFYLIYRIVNDFNEVSLQVKIDFRQLFFVFLLFFILLQMYSYRFFFFFKKIKKKFHKIYRLV